MVPCWAVRARELAGWEQTALVHILELQWTLRCVLWDKSSQAISQDRTAICFQVFLFISRRTTEPL